MPLGNWEGGWRRLTDQPGDLPVVAWDYVPSHKALAVREPQHDTHHFPWPRLERGHLFEGGMMKKLLTAMMACVLAVTVCLLVACSSSSSSSAASSASGSSTSASTASESAASESASAAASESAAAEDASASVASEEANESAAAEDASASAAAEGALAPGTYTVKFTTDNSMFHINEALDNMATLTVAENGEMTVHVVLQSKKIVNLYPGLKEDAQKEGAVILEPTPEEVTYSNGDTDEVYAFDVPVPVLEEPFDCALLGEKGTWYDHKVTVSDPQPMQEER